MKNSVILLCLFVLIIFIIPLSVFSRNKNYFELNPITPKAEKTAADISSQISEEVPAAKPAVTVEKKQNNTNFYTPKYHCDYFEIYDITEKKLKKINMRDYVIGAVAAEMPPTFHDEALKAQAVASHTLAIRNRLDNMEKPDKELHGGDFSADPTRKKGYVTKETMKEMYGDKFDFYYSKLEKVCDEVMNKILLYEEEPIISVYHSTSCGVTESAENVWQHGENYLKPVKSDGDLLSPSYETIVIFSKDDTENIIKENYRDIKLDENPENWFKIVSRSPSGYVLLVDIGDVSLAGRNIREIFGLRSTDFDVEYKDNSFIFKVRGYGHGVGLSQYGADYMARQDHSWEEILKHYYTGVIIGEIKEK